LRTKKFN